ncbi:MAG: VCBS repeat-containing protein [Myxococcales bacterium]|nr:VCBS repeat-containing protein [Myxococcales bacterium]
MVRQTWFAWVLLGVGCGDSTAAVSDGNTAGGGSTGTGACMVGFAGCPCTDDGLCLSGLECVAGVCADDGVTGGLNGTDTASASAGSGATSAASATDDGTSAGATSASASETASSASTSETASGTSAGVSDSADTSSEGGVSVSAGESSSTGDGGTNSGTSSAGEGSSTGGGPVCGDGAAEGDEACDGADLGGKTCDDFGFQYGALQCTPGCAHDASKCTNSAACGDAVVVPGMLCYAPIAEVSKYDSYRALALGDLNEDGHLDFIGARASKTQIDVWPGGGDGTFDLGAWTTNLNLKLDPSRVVDLNLDGHLDVIGPNSDTGDIQVALGDGTGKLTALAAYDSAVGRRLDLGDVDADGRLDLTVCGTQASKSVGFRRGLAGGNFGPMITYPVDPTYGAVQCGFVDFDRDGNLDIWIGRGTGNGSVFQVLYGDGAAKFALDPATSGISADYWVWAGHLGEDDYVDVLSVRALPNSGLLQVRHGTPTWLEDMLYTFEIDDWPQETAFMGNFDGNDIPDVLTFTDGNQILQVFRGDGTGLFFDGVTVVGSVAATDVAVGDLNEDGIDDMMVVRAYQDGNSLSKVHVVLSDP